MPSCNKCQRDNLTERDFYQNRNSRCKSCLSEYQRYYRKTHRAQRHKDWKEFLYERIKNGPTTLITKICDFEKSATEEQNTKLGYQRGQDITSMFALTEDLLRYGRAYPSL